MKASAVPCAGWTTTFQYQPRGCRHLSSTPGYTTKTANRPRKVDRRRFCATTISMGSRTRSSSRDSSKRAVHCKVTQDQCKTAHYNHDRQKDFGGHVEAWWAFCFIVLGGLTGSHRRIRPSWWRAKLKSVTLRMGMPRGVVLDLDAFKFYLAKRDRCEGMPIIIPSGFRY